MTLRDIIEVTTPRAAYRLASEERRCGRFVFVGVLRVTHRDNADGSRACPCSAWQVWCYA